MEHEGSTFDWSGLWTRLGVIIVALMLGVSVYGQFKLWADLRVRREAFCRAANMEHQNQRIFWKGIVSRSLANDKEAYVVIGEKRYRVVFEQPNRPGKLREFEKFTNKTFPITACGPDGIVAPTPEMSPRSTSNPSSSP